MDKVTTELIQTMKEELIECIGGPDIEDAEVIDLYETLAGHSGGKD